MRETSVYRGERARIMRSVYMPAVMVFLLMLFVGIGYGQVVDFKFYTVREGLLSDAITVLCQDSFGYLWVGTSDGVSVYNGETFKNYTVADGLASSLVNCIVEDRNVKGTMWIGTNGGGVSEFKNGEFVNYRLGATDRSNRVNAIAQARDGTVYCATDAGVYSIRNGVVANLAGNNFKVSILDIACRGDSLIVLNAKGSLTSFNLSNGTVHRMAIGWTNKSGASEFAFDTEGRFWISLDNGTIVNVTDEIAMAQVVAGPAKFIMDDKRGNLWVGTVDGLYKFRKETFGKFSPVRMTSANGLPQNNVTAGITDLEGDLWFGIASGGLCELTDQNSCKFPVDYTTIALNNSQSGSDSDGHIWVVTNEGLLEIWREVSGPFVERTHLFKDLGVSSSYHSIQITDGMNLWLGSGKGMIRSFEIKPVAGEASKLIPLRSYFVLNKFPSAQPLCFYVDREDRIWCSLNIGIIVFNEKFGFKRLRIYTRADGLPDNSIRAIYEDSKGNLWFGGYLGGIAELPSGNQAIVYHYTTKNGLPDNSVRSIAQDGEGNLWIGTRYGGLAIMQGGRFHLISVKDGLVSNGIWSMAYDKHAGMIIGTELGLQSLQNADWRRKEWRFFRGRTPIHSCGVTCTGLIWDCSFPGVTVREMAGESSARTPPLVYITGLFVNGSRVNVVDSLRLPYNRNTVTFYFNGVSLREARDLTYRYILYGADENWRFSPQAHPVTYVSLKPGSYKFEVRAIRPSGIESANGATLSLAIIPPYWQRWWFISAAVILLVSLIYFVIRIRIRRLLEIEMVRSRIATDLHDDIGSGLTRIAILADVVLRQAEAAAGSTKNSIGTAEEKYSAPNIIQRIGVNARELIDSMSDVVWSIDPENVTVGDLLKRLRSFAYEMCDGKGIKLTFEVDPNLETMWLDAGILRTLLLVTKEGLNNSVKYARCKSIRISLKRKVKNIELILSDDGCGFNGENRDGGHGLENMRTRVERLGGSFRISSSSYHGTSIHATIPVHT